MGAAGALNSGDCEEEATRHLPRLPGEQASAVDPVNFWASLPRAILRSNNAFACFLRCLLKKKPRSPQTLGITSASLWPMPLPFRFRTSSLDAPERALRNAVDLVVALLNWLHLGRPHRAPAELCQPGGLRGEQRAAVKRIQAMLREVVHHPAVAAADMGRVAAKIESLEKMVAVLQRQGAALSARNHGYHEGPCHLPRFDPTELEFGVRMPGVAKAGCVAQPVVASRVEFGSGAAFDPTEYLDAGCVDHYLHPLDFAIDERDVPTAPCARVLASPAERRQLLDKLDRSGRLCLLPAGLCRARHLNGLFTVPKSLERDRLILDARGPNDLEPGRVEWARSVASAVILFGTILKPSEVLVFSGTDLREYYYQYTVSHQRVIRNALALELTEAEARMYTCFEEKFAGGGPFRPCFASMAMGDLNSVEFGQCAHLSLALSSGSILEKELLTMKSQPSRSSIQGGIVIDDFVIAERLDRASFESRPAGTSEGARRLRLASAKYQEVKLPRNEKKTFEEELQAEFWGATLDGDAGTSRPIVSRLLPVLSLTAAVAKLGYGTRYLLEVISGFFISVFQFRRRCMSLLEEVFKAPRDIDEHVTFRFWPRLIAELWSLVVIAPVVRWNFRTSTCAEVSATDASDSWEAEVHTEVPDSFAEELWRHVLRKPVWTRLLRHDLAELREAGALVRSEELPGDEELPYHFLWRDLFCCFKFRSSWRKRILRKRHINVHELRAVLLSESRRGRRQPSSRLLTGADSQVALGCLLKGRSASSRLNGVLRASLPDYIGLDLFGAYMYVASADNPSDDGTRDKRIRDPTCEVPFYIQEALKGNYEPLDAELSEHGLDYVSLLGLPPLEDIRRSFRPSAEICRRDRRRTWLAECRASFGSRKPAKAPSSSLSCSPVVVTPRRAAPRPDPDGDLAFSPPAPVRRCDPPPGQPEAAAAGKEDEKPRLLEQAPATAEAGKLSAEIKHMLLSFEPNQFVLPKGCKTPLHQMLDAPGYLDLYSGSRGARAASSASGSWCLTFDVGHAAGEDLLDIGLQKRILTLIKAGAFRGLGGGPICSSFSRAVRPPVRSKAFPLGLPSFRESMKDKVESGNAHASFMCDAVEAGLEVGIPSWAENPHGSYLWDTPRWRALLDKFGPAGVLVVDYCRFGTPWRKRTRIFSPGVHGLGGQQLVLGDFQGWLSRELSGPARRSLCSQAMVFCILVRAYGDWLFQQGEPLYKFRHLMAYLQKNRVDLKPFLAYGWDLVTRWERVVPVVHRVPIPEAVVRALLCLGLMRKWVRWSSVLALAFYGLGRAGEPLRASRRDLLLPSDSLSDLNSGCYLAVRSPKTAFRGAGKVQHLCVKEPKIVLLPGGLRGGGAVREYKAGAEISSLMWRMRIRHMATLESYLQEVSAVSVVPALSLESRHSVAAASALLDVALATFTA